MYQPTEYKVNTAVRQVEASKEFAYLLDPAHKNVTINGTSLVVTYTELADACTLYNALRAAKLSALKNWLH